MFKFPRAVYEIRDKHCVNQRTLCVCFVQNIDSSWNNCRETANQCFAIKAARVNQCWEYTLLSLPARKYELVQGRNSLDKPAFPLLRKEIFPKQRSNKEEVIVHHFLTKMQPYKTMEFSGIAIVNLNKLSMKNDHMNYLKHSALTVFRSVISVPFGCICPFATSHVQIRFDLIGISLIRSWPVL